MTETDNSKRNVLKAAKELGICIFIALVLLMMDRGLENIYPFFLYATGKRIVDLWISFEMHMHVWLKWAVPVLFVIWLIRNKFQVHLGLLIPIAGVYFCYLITSCLSSGYTFRWWNTTELPFIMYLFLTTQCSSLKRVQRLAFTGTVLYSILLILNAVFIFFPQLYQYISGWAPEYFLSADNLTGFPMFFGLLLSFLDGYYNHSKWRMYVYFGLFFLNMALIHCASALIGCLIIILYLTIPFIRKLFSEWNFHRFTIISFAFCIFIVLTAYFFYSDGNAPQWLYDFTRGKRSILIRFIIWCGVFMEILEKPLLGYGLGEDASFFARPNTSLYYNAHNAYLQTLHEGGIVTIAAVVIVLILFSCILKKCRNRKAVGFFSAVAFSELMMMQSAITSWFTWYPFFAIIQIASLVCILEDNDIETV